METTNLKQICFSSKHLNHARWWWLGFRKCILITCDLDDYWFWIAPFHLPLLVAIWVFYSTWPHHTSPANGAIWLQIAKKKKVDGYPSLAMCPCQQMHMNSWCSSLHFCHHCMRCFLKLYSTPFIDELTLCSWKMTFAL